MDRKKRVAIFTENLYGGGVERILQIILSHFDYEKYDVTLYSNRNEVLSEDSYPTAIKHRYIFDDCSHKCLSSYWHKVKNKIKLCIYYHCSPGLFYKLFIRKKYDVAIAFIEGYATRIVSGAPSSMHLISWLHTDISNYHWTKVAFRSNAEEIECYHRFSDIICVAQSVKRQADQYLKLPNKTSVIYNPINKKKIADMSNVNINELGTKQKHKWQLLIVGTINHNKGHLRLIKALSILRKEHIDVGLWIVGYGPYYDELVKHTQELGLIKYVEFFGYRPNPYPFFKLCDIYVCASYAEGYNTAITEALILGKAVVSTECSGVKEQLGENNEFGICTPNTDEGLYEGLKQMLNDSTLNYYTMRARERGKNFSLEASMDKIYRLIES